MHDYLLSSEWVRFAFVLGIAVSMIMYEKRHLTTGSIVVPGYIAVFILHPLVIVATFVNALVTYALVNHVLRRYVLLYGRTKFTILAVTSTMIQMGMSNVTPATGWLWKSDVPLFVGVGYIVPALIAHDMARQGIRKTVTSVVIAGSIVATPIALAILFKVPGVNDLAPVDGFGQIAIDGRWIPVAMALAVAGSWAVAHNRGLRSGGFVGAAFAAMFMGNPMQVVIAIVIAALTWLFVTKVLMNHMILFGRRKFSSMLIVSSMLSWWSLWIGVNVFGPSWQLNYGVGSLALTPLMLPGLLANDAQRTSPRRVLLGLVLVTSFTLSTTWWVQTLFEPKTLDLPWKLLSVATGLVLFGAQLRLVGARLAERVPISVDTFRLRPVRPALWRPALVVSSVTSLAIGTPVRVATALLVRMLEQLRVLAAPTSPIPTPAIALETSAGPSFGTGSTTMSWNTWRSRHPEFAEAAERWLDGQLQPIRRSRPTDPRRELDGVTASILAASLRSQLAAGKFGTLNPSTQPRPSLYDLPRRVRTVAGTLDVAPEAQPATSSVPEEVAVLR